MHKIRAKERRINAYFGKSIEDKELWEYLEQYPEDERTHRLKYLARLGMRASENHDTNFNVKVSSRSQQTRNNNRTGDHVRPSQKNKLIEPDNPDQAIIPDPESQRLDNIELITHEPVDPITRLVKAQDRFIGEEDDHEILELFKVSSSFTEKRSEDT